MNNEIPSRTPSSSPSNLVTVPRSGPPARRGLSEWQDALCAVIRLIFILALVRVTKGDPHAGEVLRLELPAWLAAFDAVLYLLVTILERRRR